MPFFISCRVKSMLPRVSLAWLPAFFFTAYVRLVDVKIPLANVLWPYQSNHFGSGCFFKWCRFICRREARPPKKSIVCPFKTLAVIANLAVEHNCCRHFSEDLTKSLGTRGLRVLKPRKWPKKSIFADCNFEVPVSLSIIWQNFSIHFQL